MCSIQLQLTLVFFDLPNGIFESKVAEQWLKPFPSSELSECEMYQTCAYLHELCCGYHLKTV